MSTIDHMFGPKEQLWMKVNKASDVSYCFGCGRRGYLAAMTPVCCKPSLTVADLKEY